MFISRCGPPCPRAQGLGTGVRSQRTIALPGGRRSGGGTPVARASSRHSSEIGDWGHYVSIVPPLRRGTCRCRVAGTEARGAVEVAARWAIDDDMDGQIGLHSSEAALLLARRARWWPPRSALARAFGSPRRAPTTRRARIQDSVHSGRRSAATDWPSRRGSRSDRGSDSARTRRKRASRTSGSCVRSSPKLRLSRRRRPERREAPRRPRAATRRHHRRGCPRRRRRR